MSSTQTLRQRQPRSHETNSATSTPGSIHIPLAEFEAMLGLQMQILQSLKRSDSHDDEIAAAAKCFPEATSIERRGEDLLIWIPAEQELALAWEKALRLQADFKLELLPMAKSCP
jgi:hypothetical protein